MLYDIHTHKVLGSVDGNVSSLPSYHVSELLSLPDTFFSVGVHPWFIAQDYKAQLTELKEIVAMKNVLAIGECGLDKLKGPGMDVQIDVFEQQIAMAQTLGKPMIIHCVKAYEELLRCIKKQKVAPIFIIHGYNKNATIANQLLSSGCYLSFGQAILQDRPELHKVLAKTPDDRFFLETDSSGLNIEQIYIKAAEIRKTSMDAIILQLEKNFQTVFKR